MPDPKPPDATNLDWCVMIAETCGMAEKELKAAEAELVTLRTDAKMWREHEAKNPHGCRSINRGYHDVADLYDEEDPMPDIRSSNYKRDMAEWIERHTKERKDTDHAEVSQETSSD